MSKEVFIPYTGIKTLKILKEIIGGSLKNNGSISVESALEFANNPNDLSLKAKGIY